MYAVLITLEGESVQTDYAIVEVIEIGETDYVQVPSQTDIDTAAIQPAMPA